MYLRLWFLLQWTWLWKRYHHSGIKKPGNILVWLHIEKDDYDLPVYEQVMKAYGKFSEDIHSGKIVSAYALDRHGVIAAISKMAFGNRLGVKVEYDQEADELFAPAFGDIIGRSPGRADRQFKYFLYCGRESDRGKEICIWKCRNLSRRSRECMDRDFRKSICHKIIGQCKGSRRKTLSASDIHICSHKIGQPAVFIPVFREQTVSMTARKRLNVPGQK